MIKHKNILLISYVFPPYYGIGGRRWARHAEELTRRGYTIHVICAKNPFKKESLWYDAIKTNKNIILYQLPTYYPSVLVDYEHSFVQKLQYKFWMIILPLITKGSYFDRTIFWKKPMLKKAINIIEKYDIKHVICTGGPFGVMYFSTILKERFKDLFILNDFRDPWTWGPNWGFPNLENERMCYEKKLEGFTIEKSTIITVPNPEMLTYLHRHYPAYTHKMIELPHFYDKSELSLFAKTPSKKIRLVYYGNIYQDIENYLEVTASFLAKHQDKFTFDIYTDKSNHKAVFEKYNANNVQTFAQKPARELFKLFGNYDFVFILTPAYGKNNISTKFYEILYSQTPIILFSEDGIAAEFLETNGLGIHMNDANFESKMLDLFYKRNFKLNTNFSILEYELQEVVNKLEIILNHNSLKNPEETHFSLNE